MHMPLSFSPGTRAPSSNLTTLRRLARRACWLLLGAGAALPGSAAPQRENVQARHPVFEVLRDQAYGPHERQRMDIYRPGGTQPVHGVVFMVHGGAWRTGDKASARVVENKLARWLPRGLALVSVNYRLLPEAAPQLQADDIRQALLHAQRMAPQWGLPADRLVLMGHSAGAHLVAWVSANPEVAWRQGVQPWLGVVALDSAALDVPAVMGRRHARLYDDAFGAQAALWPRFSPLHQLTPEAPPVQLVCSTERPDQPCRQAQDFAARAGALGVRHSVLPQALSHSDINERLGLPGPYTEAVEHFMASLHPALAQALGLRRPGP